MVLHLYYLKTQILLPNKALYLLILSGIETRIFFYINTLEFVDYVISYPRMRNI